MDCTAIEVSLFSNYELQYLTEAIWRMVSTWLPSTSNVVVTTVSLATTRTVNFVVCPNWTRSRTYWCLISRAISLIHGPIDPACRQICPISLHLLITRLMTLTFSLADCLKCQYPVAIWDQLSAGGPLQRASHRIRRSESVEKWRCLIWVVRNIIVWYWGGGNKWNGNNVFYSYYTINDYFESGCIQMLGSKMLHPAN